MNRKDFESIINEGWMKFASSSDNDGNDTLALQLKALTGI